MYKCSLIIQENLINQIVNILLKGRIRFVTCKSKLKEELCKYVIKWNWITAHCLLCSQIMSSRIHHTQITTRWHKGCGKNLPVVISAQVISIKRGRGRIWFIDYSCVRIPSTRGDSSLVSADHRQVHGVRRLASHSSHLRSTAHVSFRLSEAPPPALIFSKHTFLPWPAQFQFLFCHLQYDIKWFSLIISVFS